MASTVDVDVDTQTSENNEYKNIKKEDVFINLTKSSPKSSPAWNYFGFLYFAKPSRKIVACVQNRLFCKVCSDNSTEKVFFAECKVKSYSSNTSTSSLFHHLENDHKISISSKTLSESTKSIQGYFRSERDIRPAASSKKKFLLIRDFVLVCCRDLLPFNLVEGAGLQDFLEKYKVADKDDLPNPTSISRALGSVYDDCKIWLVGYLKSNCPDTISITFDLWSCKYRRPSYITLTLHYVNNAFELVNLTLSTSYFPESHKGINILPRVESILDSYGLIDKDITMVTDAAGNMNTTCNLGSYKHRRCIGHGLHNLVTVDGFKKTVTYRQLLKKVRMIVKTLRYRVSEFERLSTDEEHFLSEMSKLNEEYFLFDDDDEESDDDTTEHENNFCKKPKSLKIDVKTRWNSAVPMIESILAGNKSVVNLMLQKAEHPEYILSIAEYSLLKELLKLLKHFQVITAIFSGDKYATLNFYVLFRQEIHSLLESEPQDSLAMKELKGNMLKNLDKRFPLSDITIIASLLDPRFQNLLDVKKYIAFSGSNAVDFIQKYWNDNFKDHKGTSVDIPENGNIPVKKSYIDDMAEKHSTLASLSRISTSNTDLQRECFLLLSMGGVVEVTTILSFWNDNSKAMPLLSKLARDTFCTPASSTPSERNFSTAGLVANSKKSQILPENLNKVCFMHNNYDFLKKNCTSIMG